MSMTNETGPIGNMLLSLKTSTHKKLLKGEATTGGATSSDGFTRISAALERDEKSNNVLH